eukprot:Skav219449  [mRNA]  locus=scaffold2583:12562:15651:+ [translate_table: standard]
MSPDELRPDFSRRHVRDSAPVSVSSNNAISSQTESAAESLDSARSGRQTGQSRRSKDSARERLTPRLAARWQVPRFHQGQRYTLAQAWQVASKVLCSEMVSDSVPGREVLTVFRTIAVFSFGIVFGTLMASHYHHLLEAPAKISYDLAQNMSKANENAAHIEQGDPNDNAAHIEQGDPNDDAAHIEQGDQNHNDAHIEQGDPNENAAHIEHEDPNDSAAHIEHGDPNCIKFVMFTTQRSG